jgi:hypothetical protein
MPNPYAGSGSIVRTPPTISASRPWGKRNYNLTGAKCSPVTITDKQGNTRVVAPLVVGKVVRLARKSQQGYHGREADNYARLDRSATR